MSRLITEEQWRARGEAYKEAAEHLLLSWTDDPIEQDQGESVSKILQRSADVCFRRADKMKKGR